MDQHAELAGEEAKGARLLGVADLVDAIELEEVVAGAERAHLVAAATARRLRHRGRIGPLQPPALLRTRQIGGAAEAAPDRPRCAILEHRADLGVIEPPDGVRGADTGGNVALELPRGGPQARPDLVDVD